MIQNWVDHLAMCTGMIESDVNPFGCGTYLKGSGKYVSGFAWYYRFKSELMIIKCDFVLTNNVHLDLSEEAKYFGLRLDYAGHLAPGKILAFWENDRINVNAVLKKGVHMAYTEVLYDPRVYDRYLKDAFSDTVGSPENFVRSLGTSYHWSAAVTKAMYDISRCTSTGAAAELYYIGKSYELLSALMEMGTQRLPHKSEDYIEIQKVLHYIDEHYQGEIRQADLLRLVSMSPTKLKTVFRKYTDSSITDYILDKKFEHAIHLLSETDMQVDEIGRQLGFTTASGFSTSFRKRHGISPANYRKQLRSPIVDQAAYLHSLNQSVEDLYSIMNDGEEI